MTVCVYLHVCMFTSNYVHSWLPRSDNGTAPSSTDLTSPQRAAGPSMKAINHRNIKMLAVLEDRESTSPEDMEKWQMPLGWLVCVCVCVCVCACACCAQGLY